MDTVTYPHPEVREELEHWVEGKVDVSQMTELARLLNVTAIPVAIAFSPNGSILERRLNFVEPAEFREWLESTRSMHAR